MFMSALLHQCLRTQLLNLYFHIVQVSAPQCISRLPNVHLFSNALPFFLCSPTIAAETKTMNANRPSCLLMAGLVKEALPYRIS